MKYSALIGNPVEHSVSPQLFDLLAEKHRLEYAHIKIKVETKDMLENTIKAMRDLNFIGFNVTVPYKLDMFDLVDVIDNETKMIHSINSVSFMDGKTNGVNTDGKAAIYSIEHFRKILPSDKIVIIGSGGVAYSIVFELAKITNNIIIFNEDCQKALEMCKKLNLPDINCYDLSELTKVPNNKIEESQIIINATSVGMLPNNTSLLSQDLIKSLKTKKIFFDVVFNPSETELLKVAKTYKHDIVSGVYMLVYQATLVLDFWLNQKTKYSKKEIEELVEKMYEIIREDGD